MDFIFWLAYCFYQGLVGIWWLMEKLPWPTWAELFKSLIVFVFLWRPRKWLERYWLSKPIRKRRGNVPSTTDHQAASSSLGSIFEHH